MQLHTIQRHTPNKQSPAVGRGGKRGKTSGRGTKGQKARAGRKMYPEIRDVIKRIPKLRGRGKNIFQSIQVPFVSVNVSSLNVFSDGDVVTPSTLVAKGIVSITKGKNPQVKILGEGELSKKLTVKGCRVSFGAGVKITKAGGTLPTLKKVEKTETPKPASAPKKK